MTKQWLLGLLAISLGVGLGGCCSYNSKISLDTATLKPLKEPMARKSVVYVSGCYNRRGFAEDRPAVVKNNFILVSSLSEFARYCKMGDNRTDYYLLKHSLETTSLKPPLDYVIGIFAISSAMILPARHSTEYHAQWDLYRFDPGSGVVPCSKPIEYDVKDVTWFSLLSPLGLLFPGGINPFDYSADLCAGMATKCCEHLLASASDSGVQSVQPLSEGASAKVLNSLSVRIFRNSNFDENKAYVISISSGLHVNEKNAVRVDPGMNTLQITHDTMYGGDYSVSYKATTLTSNLKPGYLYLVDRDSLPVSQVRIFELGLFKEVAPVLYAYLD